MSTRQESLAAGPRHLRGSGKVYRVFMLVSSLAMLASLGACSRWTEDMWKQPKYVPGRPAPLFNDGQVERAPPAGTIVHGEGELAGTSSGRLGAGEEADTRRAEEAQIYPQPLTQALLDRGRERYGIYCLPCHSPVGDGDGWVVRRGFPAPPSYHSDRLRQAPDRHFYDVISKGYGVMYSYADRIEPQDRWAIVAFIRALQWSQHADVARLPPQWREQIGKQEQATPASLPRKEERAS